MKGNIKSDQEHHIFLHQRGEKDLGPDVSQKIFAFIGHI